MIEVTNNETEPIFLCQICKSDKWCCGDSKMGYWCADHCYHPRERKERTIDFDLTGMLSDLALLTFVELGIPDAKAKANTVLYALDKNPTMVQASEEIAKHIKQWHDAENEKTKQLYLDVAKEIEQKYEAELEYQRPGRDIT